MTTPIHYDVHPAPRHWIHTALAQFPIVCFTLTLATDIAYWGTGNLMWKNFGSWLLFVGLVMGVLAAIAGIIDALVNRRRRAGSTRRMGWLHGLGSLVVLALALLNNFLHAGDGWTAIVPWGLTVSALTVIVMIASAWLGRLVAERNDMGVARHA